MTDDEPPQSSLYREQALQSRVKGFSNPISIRGYLPVSVMLTCILAIIAGFLVFGLMNDYIRRVVVQGYLEPIEGTVAINAPTTGRLSGSVANGTRVERGALIARVVTGDVNADGQSSVDVQLDGLKKRSSITESQLKLVHRRLASVDDQENTALALHQKKTQLVDLQLELQRSELDNADSEFKRIQDLVDRGLTPSSEIAPMRQALLAARQRVLEADSRRDVLKSELQQLKLEWDAQRIELTQSLTSLEKERAVIENDIQRLNASRVVGIFAPVSGIVTTAQAQNNEQVSAGQPLFTMRAEGSELVGILLAPSSAIGFVEPSDIVQIRYNAFPYREHGVFEGDVFELDASAQLSSAFNAPVTLAEPVYRIRVRVDQNPENKSGQSLRLASGMLFEASVIVDKKPLLFWVLDPVL